jgi:hypothetical protein
LDAVKDKFASRAVGSSARSESSQATRFPANCSWQQLLRSQVAVSEMLTGDIGALRTAVALLVDSMNVALSLPRRIAEKVLELLDAKRTTGGVVAPVKELFTTTTEATMLRASRVR